MANNSVEETSSTCSSSDEYSDGDDFSGSGNITLRKTVSELSGGATGTSDKHADICAVASPLAAMDDKKREILDVAVDAVLSKKERIKDVRAKFKLTFAELDQALLEKGAADIVGQSRRHRRIHNPKTADLLRKAVKDVTSNGMTVENSARLHKINRRTLKLKLIDQGVQFPLLRNKPALEAAVRDVVEQKLAVKTAGRIHKVGPVRLQKHLKALGYSFQGSGQTGNWIKARSESYANTETTTVRVYKAPENRGTNSWDEVQDVEQQAQKTAQNDGAYGDQILSETTQEIEKIVDLRTSRQYLVKWQGEEEATWVDEDVFLGLTKLNIGQD